MAGFTDKLKGILGAVAPTIGLALGGPLGSAAGTVLRRALGQETATDEELEATVATADPETLLKIKSADLEFQKFLKQADIQIEQLANEDRANARSREIQLHDKTPAVLAWAITLGLFAVLLWMLKYGLPATGEQALLVMLGSLSTAFISVVSFYFGSSSSSRHKDATISEALKKA